MNYPELKPMTEHEWRKYVGNYINKICDELDRIRARLDELEKEGEK